MFFRGMNKLKKSMKISMGSASGQVAIVLMLVIAAGLIFYAASLNIGVSSQTKTLVTIASNTSAAMLASDMASYGQALSSTSLGGKKKVCAMTGVLAAIISIVIIIIAIFAPYLIPALSAFALTGPALVMAVVGLVMAVVSLAIQVLVIQPGLTEAWNRVIQETLDQSNQFTETSVQAALSKAVTDPVQVPDVNDMDGDRIWVKKSDVPEGEFNPRDKNYADMVSRYGVYYTERLKNIAAIPIIPEVENFINALREFLYEGEDDWGLYDPIIESDCKERAECHPCCVADEFTTNGELIQDFRPDECNPLVNWEAACSVASPYHGVATKTYPWIYDKYYENPMNAFRSFRELIGFDDEHKNYYKDSNDPGSDPAATAAAGRNSQREMSMVVPNNPKFYTFRIEDATGFYVPPFYQAPSYTPAWPDPRVGIYPFFYKMKDWGVDLTQVRPAVTNTPMHPDFPYSRMCFWCDERDVNCPDCDMGLRFPPFPQPEEIKDQLVLPLNPTGFQNNTSWFVDGIDQNKPGLPPLAVDKITSKYLVAEDGVCVQDGKITDNIGIWKPGADRFCSNEFPYHAECSSAGVCATNPDDFIDAIVYKFPEFFEAAEALLAQAKNFPKFNANFVDWYPDIAPWIESPALCHECDWTDIPEGEGFLHTWLKIFQGIRNRLEGWKTNWEPASGTNNGYAGTCDEVWCVSSTACPLVWDDEDATFDSNGNGVTGDVMDIIACLEHNIDDGVTGGNADRFQACFDACGACQADAMQCTNVVAESCGGAPNNYLPRSLIRDTATSVIFDPTREFRANPVNVAGIAALLACPGTCTDCDTICDNTYTACDNACSMDAVICNNTCTNDFNICWAGCGVDPVCQAGCTATRAACNNTCLVTQTACDGVCLNNQLVCQAACVCEGFSCETDIMVPPLPPPAPPSPYHAALAGNQGVCQDPATLANSFLDKIQRSIPEAENQVAKFLHRKTFLEARIADIDKIVPIFDEGIKKLDEFLKGPAADLIRARKNFKESDYGLPYEAIYGWRDMDRVDRRGKFIPGQWHFVKTEARVPGRCDNGCGVNPSGTDPKWPRIKTYTKGFLKSKRCYELVNTSGRVKFRTTRWDEPRSSDKILTFPNKVPIWKFNWDNPGRSGLREKVSTMYPGANPNNQCLNHRVTTFPGTSTSTSIYYDAFMVAPYFDANSGDALDAFDPQCYQYANSYLSMGVMNETCAQYYWHETTSSVLNEGSPWAPPDNDYTRGMSFRFIKCRGDF